MNNVIIENNDKVYRTQIDHVRVQQNISMVSESIHIKIHYNSPVHGGKEVKHHGKGKGF
jgi:hypothetical protein